jgi:nucleotide-binding universal stress UspA family protein
MKVLVAIDNSLSSNAILDVILTATWPAATTFCVLNVTDLQRFERLPALIEDAEREGYRITETFARQINAAGYEAFPMTSSGHPRSEISCYAKEWGADLILVGSHGHGAVGRFLLGSVAQAVLRTAPCSVEIVRPVSHLSPFKVLFATDGSDCSTTAARMIAEEPWPKESVFKILSAEELMTASNEMDASSLAAVYPASLLEELVTQAHDWARLAVCRAKDILSRAGLKTTEGDSSPVGDPRAVILDVAKAWGAQLIVVGSHGRRGIDRFLMGSVSEAVAIHASCSVRVIRPRADRKGDPRVT